jgi:hypothetical protein
MQVAATDPQPPSPVEPLDERRFRVVAIVAAVLYAPQVLTYFALPFVVVPAFKQMFEDMGGSLPPITLFILSAGPWLGVALGVIAILVFWFFYVLARKYWVGLLFAPLFAGSLLAGPLVWALYQPMFQVITLVK